MTAALSLGGVAAAASGEHPGKPHEGPLGHYKHLVVIYEENHSFDNLYGGWGDVGGHAVVGRSAADAAHTTQVSQAGTPYTCLRQNDVNLDTDAAGSTLTVQPACHPETVTFPDGSTASYTSHFLNQPFNIDQYIPADATTCPRPNKEFSAANGIKNGSTNPDGSTVGLPGGCTRDLVHKFYQEQYQLNGGQQNRYTTGSDAVGLTQGYYDTTRLPIYSYLHGKGAPRYVIADHFFQAAFGGSYLNHQYLVAAQPALTPNSFAASQHAVLDPHGIPHAYPLLKPTGAPVDGNVTQACGTATTVAGLACGNWAVNTLQPPYEPQGSFGAKEPAIDDSTKDLNIGDRMSDGGVSWAWYAGGWDNANGNVGGPGWTNGTTPGACTDPNHSIADAQYPFCPDSSFQFHHQPFNYFTRYAPGTTDRAAHLKDEVQFIESARHGTLPQVSFVKPVGNENEHPGYSSEPNGSDHLVDLIKAVEEGPQAGNTLIVVTYDEFGGQWDHVSPPGLGTPGPHDQFGPGTRIPALLLSRSMTRSGVSHEVYDTTSIMATIEHQFGLKPVDAAGDLTPRDATVSDLGAAVAAGRPEH
jgi:phospholipase C